MAQLARAAVSDAADSRFESQWGNQFFKLRKDKQDFERVQYDKQQKELKKGNIITKKDEF